MLCARMRRGIISTRQRKQSACSVTLLVVRTRWVDESDQQEALCKLSVAAFHLLVVLSHSQIFYRYLVEDDALRSLGDVK